MMKFVMEKLAHIFLLFLSFDNGYCGCSGNVNQTKDLCGAKEFQCEGDGTCIDKEFRCDQQPDCLDESDEKDCKNTAVCSENMDACMDGNGCFRESDRCDNVSTCADHTDEKDCGLQNGQNDTQGRHDIIAGIAVLAVVALAGTICIAAAIRKRIKAQQSRNITNPDLWIPNKEGPNEMQSFDK
ncbi:TMPS6-like protein [Mya arenaria]|uniref:TMPS6-like protein n=1 Tax=Mya arenaria TaxID=6604 RepID=A0ABY7EJQ6_MYAAR|nr:TMPS6-like protein [Mya arenaria]